MRRCSQVAGTVMSHAVADNLSWMPLARVAGQARRAAARCSSISSRYSEVAAQLDPAATAERVPALWRGRGYSDVPPELSAAWDRLRRSFGEEGLAACNRLLLCTLIATAERRLAETRLPLAIMNEYVSAFDRILGKLDDESYYRDSADDTFLKDLGICALTLIPVGYYVLEHRWRMHKYLLFTGGLLQALRYLRLYIVRYRRRGPFLFVHYHDDHKAQFTPEGRIATFRLIAELLESRPQVKAVMGSSWFYDPALKAISPHLAYLREMPQTNGAVFFRARPTSHKGVFSSRTRTRLFREGRYKPRNYAMLWPREKLLAWSRTLD